MLEEQKEAQRALETIKQETARNAKAMANVVKKTVTSNGTTVKKKGNPLKVAHKDPAPET